jgi:hydrogenase-1 operon protein HyaF
VSATDTIQIHTETFVTADSSYQNTLPLLHEINHALHRLQRRGKATTLDLGAIPFGPGDEQRLLHFLGEGEVSARLRAMGESAIWESAYAGVWIIEHRSTSGERVAFQIEITKLPAILESQPEDIEDSLSTLQQALENLKADGPI